MREPPSSAQHSHISASTAVAAAAVPEDIALSPILRNTVSPDPVAVSLQSAAQVFI